MEVFWIESRRKDWSNGSKGALTRCRKTTTTFQGGALWALACVPPAHREEKGIRGDGHGIWEWRNKCREPQVLAGSEEIHEASHKSLQGLACVVVKSPLCGNDL
ncbi:hypothetical protein E2C01_056046 [Portunus trituberculatus]|uniref:Uncharacterized protein n=1 Tax=Portunus trituberculatus TaxID=210409 RepID=A0A5B7GWB2_PORTR|nr:hypothetical protein [Portunus trituberculatus]